MVFRTTAATWFLTVVSTLLSFAQITFGVFAAIEYFGRGNLFNELLLAFTWSSIVGGLLVLLFGFEAGVWLLDSADTKYIFESQKPVPQRTTLASMRAAQFVLFGFTFAGFWLLHSQSGLNSDPGGDVASVAFERMNFGVYYPQLLGLFLGLYTFVKATPIYYGLAVKDAMRYSKLGYEYTVADLTAALGGRRAVAP